jgi:hypothetical protein
MNSCTAPEQFVQLGGEDLAVSRGLAVEVDGGGVGGVVGEQL